MKKFDRQSAFRIEALVFHVLLVVAVAAAGWLTQRYSLTWDWSGNARNSLSAPSQQLLARLQAPLRITSFAPEDPVLRQRTRELIDRYQRYRPDITLDFVDPARNPALTRQLGIRVSGELRLEYQGRGENLRLLDEQSISNAIQRLMQQGERWIVVPDGHGERSVTGRANHDLGNFGAELARKGYRLQPIQLAAVPEIPENTSLLLIASPQFAYLDIEAQKISDYVARGGNLLWLIEPGEITALEDLAKAIGIELLPGTVVDANGAGMGLDDPAVALVPRYPEHPATQGFSLVTLYPHAAALKVSGQGDWQASVLLQTLAGSWNETGPIRGEVARDAELGETPGPLDIGIALTRPLAGGQQRLLVVGDGDFLSNSYLGNGGNLDLGLNLVRWLTGDDQLFGIAAKTTNDLNLELSPVKGAIIGLGFLIVLPLTLATAGLIIWWRRRRL